MTTSASESSALDLTAANDTFLRLWLGSSRPEVEKSGAKIFEINHGTQFRGDVFSVAFLPVEPPGIFKRTLYFHKDFGLYRARWEIGSPDRGNNFSAPELFDRWKELLGAFQRANSSAKLIKHSYPDVHDISFDDLRECPKGSQKIRDNLARITDDEYRRFLTEALDARPGESCGPKCLTFAIMCGVTKPFRATYLVAPDQTVHLATSTDPTGRSTIIVVFANKRIADVMFDKSKPPDD